MHKWFGHWLALLLFLAAIAVVIRCKAPQCLPKFTITVQCGSQAPGSDTVPDFKPGVEEEAKSTFLIGEYCDTQKFLPWSEDWSSKIGEAAKSGYASFNSYLLKTKEISREQYDKFADGYLNLGGQKPEQPLLDNK